MADNPFVYTMYARPLNVQKGDKARVYLRKFSHNTEDPVLSRGTTQYIDISVDATIASLELEESSAEYLTTKLNESVPKGITFHEGKFDDTHNVILAELDNRNKESRNELDTLTKKLGVGRQFFLHKQYSGSQDLRYKFPPFSTPIMHGLIPNDDHQGWVTQAHRTAPLEQLLLAVRHDVHLCYDIEVEGWDKPGAPLEISMIVAETNKPWLPRVLFTRYDPKVAEIDGYDIVVFNDHNELQKKFLEYITLADPLIIGGYNLQYDLLTPRKLMSHFTPGVDDTEPKVISASGRTTSMQAHGRFVIDHRNKAEQELSYLVNRKLATTLHHLQSETGTHSFRKSLNYTQLAQALADAKVGNMDGLRKALAYTAADGHATMQLHNNQWEEIFLDAILLHRRPESICKGYAGSADEKWEREFFEQHSTSIHRNKRKYVARLKPHEDQRRFFVHTARRDADGKILLQRTDGTFRNVAFFYPTLYANAAAPILSVSPKLRQLDAYYENMRNTKQYRGMRKLTEIMVLPITAYLNAATEMDLPPELPMTSLSGDAQHLFAEHDKEFCKSYGNGQIGIKQFNAHFAEQVRIWHKTFDPSGVINYDSNFLLLEADLAFCMQEEHLGITLAHGPALSAGQHGFLYNKEQDTLYVMHSKLTPSAVTDWEKNTIQSMLKDALMQIGISGKIDYVQMNENLRRHVEKIRTTDRSQLLFTRHERLPHDGTLTSITMQVSDNRELRHCYGYIDMREVPELEFFSSAKLPDTQSYRSHFLHKYSEILDALLRPRMQQSLFSA